MNLMSHAFSLEKVDRSDEADELISEVGWYGAEVEKVGRMSTVSWESGCKKVRFRRPFLRYSILFTDEELFVWIQFPRRRGFANPLNI
jgi:hypothetical protein